MCLGFERKERGSSPFLSLPRGQEGGADPNPGKALHYTHIAEFVGGGKYWPSITRLTPRRKGASDFFERVLKCAS